MCRKKMHKEEKKETRVNNIEVRHMLLIVNILLELFAKASVTIATARPSTILCSLTNKNENSSITHHHITF